MNATEPKNVPDEISKVEPISSPLNTFGYVFFFVVLFQALLLIGINLYQDSQIRSSKDRIDRAKATLNDSQHQVLNSQVSDVLKGQNQLVVALDNKIRWSTFYGLLNIVTPRNVVVTDFSVTEEGSFRADGRTNSLSSLAQLLVAWEKSNDTPFSSIQLTGNGFSEDRGTSFVTFSISGQIDLNKVRGR